MNQHLTSCVDGGGIHFYEFNDLISCLSSRMLICGNLSVDTGSIFDFFWEFSSFFGFFWIFFDF